MEKQSYNILCHYLKKSEIFFNKTTLKQLITSHPDGDSFYAMVDTLNEINIKNIALKSDIKGLQSNGFPAIAFIITKEERKFIVVEDISENQVYYYDAHIGDTNESIEEFVRKWTGIALYAEQDEIQAELEQKKNISEKRLLHWRTILTVFSGLTCIVMWSVSIVWSPILCSLLSLCLCGLVISILLTMEEFDESNQFLHKVCHLNRVTNCNAVLRSGVSKLFGWLSMADIGLCYFVGCIFSLFVAGVGQQLNVVVCWLLVLALCSFPYTVFSLSYQIFKIKKVCPFCLGVVGVLWTQIVLCVFYWKSLTFIPISPTTVLSLFVGFAMPVIIWAYVKPLWKENIRMRNYEYNYLRLKRIPAVIHALLSTEPCYTMDYSPDEIHLGTIDSPIHVTIVISLDCKPCGDSWTMLSRWLITYPGLFCLTVRFSGYNDGDRKNDELIDGLTEIYSKSGSYAFCNALADWNENRDIQMWKAKYYANKPITPQLVSLQTANWQQSNFITSAPTAFVDSRIFRYELSDLECLLKTVK
jgi:uncharacterized membrane protein